MANKIQLKRGLKSQLPALSQGEPAYTTDTREFFLGTGSGNVNMGGSQWYTGTGMSGTSTSTTYYYSACPQVKVGDMFLNTSNGNVYQCTTAGSETTARWTYKGNIKGAAGAKGDQGDSVSTSELYPFMAAFVDDYCGAITLANVDIWNYETDISLEPLGAKTLDDLRDKIYKFRNAPSPYNAITCHDHNYNKIWHLLDFNTGESTTVNTGKTALIKFGDEDDWMDVAFVLAQW